MATKAAWSSMIVGSGDNLSHLFTCNSCDIPCTKTEKKLSKDPPISCINPQKRKDFEKGGELIQEVVLG